jgi:hypothetical protein
LHHRAVEIGRLLCRFAIARREMAERHPQGAAELLRRGGASRSPEQGMLEEAKLNATFGPERVE